jgi:hypothetical protein
VTIAVTPMSLRRRCAVPPTAKETAMFRFRTLAITGAAALGLAGAVVAGPASAAGDPDVGTQVLDLLCASRSGTPFFTPFTISRCQEARPGQGFDVEELICEGLLAGTFESVPSPNRPNRANWFCFHGPISH